MQRSVVFVHGTGVREESYNKTFATVRSALAWLQPGAEVRGCFWGREAGAGLALEGASIPGYTDSAADSAAQFAAGVRPGRR